MAYSRWGSSRWYTFWSIDSGETKNDQRFEIMVDVARSIVFTYKELKENHGYCMIRVIDLCNNPKEYTLLKNDIVEEFISDPNPSTDEELVELEKYIQRFIEDVEIEYSFIGRISETLCKWPSPFKDIGFWLWLKLAERNNRI